MDLSRIRLRWNRSSVWGQAFEEAWRLQRDFYWAEDMAGLDWQGVYDRYRPLVERLGSHDDLVDLLWELHGELGTSHAYVMPAPVTEPGAGKQGLLGADLVRTYAGWAVHKILAGESSDPLALSPLTAPGAAVQPGDVIAAVDGIPVDPLAGPAPLLVGAAGKTVELTIVNGTGSPEAGLQPADCGDPDPRRGAASVPELGRRQPPQRPRRVERTSGYLHIPDMVARGWAQLHRDLDVETAKDGLVIDVRRNRGGHTSQLVAELIGRKVSAWSLARGEQPGTYPAHAPRGPVVVLTDEYAGSDGDIITQVSKLRGIGPVIGTRTWGGVVGIDAKFALADGTGVTQPRYGCWFTQGVGWGVENYGVEPDIEVPFPPHAYGAGEDPQLEHGVGILKEMLGEVRPTSRRPAPATLCFAPGRCRRGRRTCADLRQREPGLNVKNPGASEMCRGSSACQVLAGQGGVKRDAGHRRQGAGYRTVLLGAGGQALEIILADAGHGSVDGQADLGDAGPRDEVHRRRGLDALRGGAVFLEHVAELHRVAGGMGGSQKLFGAGLSFGLLRPCLPGDIVGADSGRFESRLATAGEEIALPFGARRTCCSHVSSLVEVLCCVPCRTGRMRPVPSFSY